MHDLTTRGDNTACDLYTHGIRPYLVMQNPIEEEKIAERMKDYGYRHPASPQPLKRRLAYALGSRMVSTGLWLLAAASPRMY